MPMSPYLRLRQIACVDLDLERVEADLAAVLGLSVCHRDPSVALFGLRNLLCPIGSSFIEVVSPLRPGTTAERFYRRHGGRFGYMLILDCDDPARYKARAAALGMRVAHEGQHEIYTGIQLHPKDTGATMIEFNHTVGGEVLDGPYWPAGPQWQQYATLGAHIRLCGVEIDCVQPAEFASRWAALFDRPVVTDGPRSGLGLALGARWESDHKSGHELDHEPDHERDPGLDGIQDPFRIDLDGASIHFMHAKVEEPVFAGLRLAVRDPALMIKKAAARGLATTDSTLEVAGLRMRLQAV